MPWRGPFSSSVVCGRLDRREAADARADEAADALARFDPRSRGPSRRPPAMPAAIANWVKRSSVFASRVVIQRVGSKSFTSPAKCVAKCGGVEVRDRADAGLAGEQPLPRLVGADADGRDEPDAGDDDPACHVRSLLPRTAARSRVIWRALDVVDRVPDGPDLLGVLVGDLDLELLLERQHQLDDGQRVGPQVVDERGLGLDLLVAPRRAAR